MQGESLAQTICGNPTKYEPRIWFNSAKFFDIEYQTYGTVLPQNPEGQQSLYWENSDGKKCIHIVYETDSKAVKGFNFFGTRFRHQVCEKWLEEKKTIEFVLINLKEARWCQSMALLCLMLTHEHHIKM